MSDRARRNCVTVITFVGIVAGLVLRSICRNHMPNLWLACGLAALFALLVFVRW